MKPLKPIVYSNHARTGIRERNLLQEWVEKAVREPHWTSPDSRRVGIERRFRELPERCGRVLRVAVVETDLEIRIVTAFLDRRAGRPK